ncbi:hypothetical protein BXY66_0016 [Shimia isoporae]|uniref:HPt domain-containing protein n=1 Tax=Shimia isoporae TaxID=647720 RepID=A0A4R1NJ05_9RHOB|nr:hypothetical protein [Shimia isoporae]TCL07985.1 hypothetical protein BXY66_0016 [Shimia isoporae]
MTHVTRLHFNEAVHVNEDELTRLYIKMDFRQAERLIIEAIDTLSQGLADAETAYGNDEERHLMAACRKIAKSAQRLGLDTLATVARDVRIAMHQQDRHASHATLARLMRLGEPSLRELWHIKAIQV